MGWFWQKKLVSSGGGVQFMVRLDDYDWKKPDNAWHCSALRIPTSTVVDVKAPDPAGNFKQLPTTNYTPDYRLHQIAWVGQDHERPDRLAVRVQLGEDLVTERAAKDASLGVARLGLIGTLGAALLGGLGAVGAARAKSAAETEAVNAKDAARTEVAAAIAARDQAIEKLSVATASRIADAGAASASAPPDASAGVWSDSCMARAPRRRPIRCIGPKVFATDDPTFNAACAASRMNLGYGDGNEDQLGKATTVYWQICNDAGVNAPGGDCHCAGKYLLDGGL